MVDQMTARLHWNIYKGLEREFLCLAETIHINDRQVSVYSLKIAELLIRTAAEIESISKDLYCAVSGLSVGRETYFDTDCLKYLNDKWHLEKRVIYVNSQSVYFEEEANRIFAPLKKASVQGACDWKKAYQAVKHNGRMSIEKGNLKNFLKALAALYLLNVYYKGYTEHLVIGDAAASRRFNGPRDSDIFLVKVSSLGESVGSNGYLPKRDLYDDCTYLVRPSEASLQGMVDAINKTNRDLVLEITSLLNNLSSNGWRGSKGELDKMIADARSRGAKKHSGDFIKAYSTFQYEAELNLRQYDPPRLLAYAAR